MVNTESTSVYLLHQPCRLRNRYKDNTTEMNVQPEDLPEIMEVDNTTDAEIVDAEMEIWLHGEIAYRLRN